jgi:hypothetical protein
VGDLIDDPFESLRDDRSLRRRQASLEAEPTSAVLVPVPEGPVPLELRGLILSSPHLEVRATTDGGARGIARPADQLALGLGRGEATQLDDLVDAEHAGLERVGDARQFVERRGGLDPPVRLPPRHAVADGEPMRDVSSARVPPRSPSIDLGDDAEQRHLRRGDVAVQRVGDADQPIVVEIVARE